MHKVRKIIEKYANQIAAILIDPFGQMYGRKIPTDEFLNTLKHLSAENNILLIADEVISFRAGYSGCQKDRDLNPHLTALGKIIGGGFPIGAVAGHQDVMNVFESQGRRAKLPHGGTFNANPVSMVAGKKAMEMMGQRDFKKLNDLGSAFRKALRDVILRTDIEASVEGQYSIFGIKTDNQKLSDSSERGKKYESSGLHRYMLNNGYWLTPGLTGVCSTVMDHSDIDPFCDTLIKGIKHLLR